MSSQTWFNSKGDPGSNLAWLVDLFFLTGAKWSTTRGIFVGIKECAPLFYRGDTPLMLIKQSGKILGSKSLNNL